MGTLAQLISSFGGGKRDRTADLLHAMQALSQLSYTPVRRRNRIIDDYLSAVKFLYNLLKLDFIRFVTRLHQIRCYAPNEDAHFI